jgi:hypothetical protein
LVLELGGDSAPRRAPTWCTSSAAVATTDAAPNAPPWPPRRPPARSADEFADVLFERDRQNAA